MHLQVVDNLTKFLSVSEDGCCKIWSLENAYITHSGKTFDQNGFEMAIPSPRTRQESWVNLFGQNGIMDDSQTLRLSDDMITTACFSHTNDKLVVTGTQKGVVVVWDLDNDEQIFSVRHHTTEQKISCCTFSYNDKLVIFSSENLIFVYDLYQEEYLSQFNNDVRTHSLLTIPNWDDNIIAVSDKSLCIWQWEESPREGGGVVLEKPQRIILDTREDATYVCAAVTWDGNYLVAGSSDRSINMWNIQMREKVKEICQRSGGLVMCLDTFLNEESNSNVMYILLSGSDDRSVKQWHISPLENHKNSKLSMNFTTHWLNGQTPLTAAINSDNKIQVYSSHALVAETDPLDKPKCITFSPCGNEIAVGLANGLVKVFNYRNKTYKSVMNLESELVYLEYHQHSTTILLVAGGFNGCLMINTNGKSVRLKNRNTTKQKSVTVKCFLLHTTGHLLSVEDDGCIKSWKLQGM